MGFFRPYLPQVLIAMTFGISVSFVEGGIALFIRPVVDEIFFGNNIAFLKLIPFFLLAMVAAKGIFSYFHTYILERVGMRVIVNIRTLLFKHYLKLSQSQFDHLPVGHLMSRITTDVGGMNETIPAFINILRQSFTLLTLLAVALYRDWLLTLIGLSVVPFTGLPVWFIGEKLKKYRRKTLRSMGSLNTIAYEAFGGIQIIKAFCAEDIELEKFKKEHVTYFKSRMNSLLVGQWAAPVTELISIAGVGTVFMLGGLKAIRGDLTPGEFLSFVAAVILMYRPIRRLSDIYKELTKLLASAERVFEALDEKPLINEKPDAAALDPIKEKIEFRDVWFSYPLPSIQLLGRDEDLDADEKKKRESERGWVLKGLSFTVNKGETVALVGSSGAGKSTVASLMPRFYDAGKGEISIDGINISEVTFESLRSQIAIVSQETFLFNESVRNNIAYGLPRDVKMLEIIEAAKAADAHDFIMNLPDGYKTAIGERGVKMSGGQRQRLAIARALLRNSPILILDEATSNLDSEAELEVQRALEILMKDRTTIVIAHRLSTIRDATRIVVLDGGRKVEEGAHAELLAKGGVYKKLYELQYFGHDRDDLAAAG